ncbi:hypothetical protein CWC48_01390 [Pseudomonas sp. S10E 269]|nr:hypothetical protein CWC49_11550 [Pseudomonas sp. S09F 262]PJK37824.1 hypothetical protein CWC48_01390 [Pseudomonas sp. S10E 269]
MWERACSRMQWFSQLMHRLTHCFLEQARSHIRSAAYFLPVIGYLPVHSATRSGCLATQSLAAASGLAPS